MDRIKSHSVANYLRVAIFLAACLLLALAFVLLFTSASASLPRQPKLVGASVTPTTSITTTANATDTSISTPTYTPTSTPTPYPTETPVPTSTPCAIQFSDVPPGSTFYEYVRCLVCRGILDGYPDGTYRPGVNVTRGQLSKIAVNAGGLTGSIPPDQQTFEDVPIGSTFWWYIEELVFHGIVGGYRCGGPGEPCLPPNNRPYFRPGADANREQAALIVDRVAGFASNCIPVQNFQDVPINSAFWCSIQRLYERNIISGYPCGGPGEPCIPPLNRPYYRPDSTSTRGQLVKMVARTFLPNCDSPVDNR
jgi:S-layer homology domain